MTLTERINSGRISRRTLELVANTSPRERLRARIRLAVETAPTMAECHAKLDDIRAKCQRSDNEALKRRIRMAICAGCAGA
jgi:hypothetical protein